VSLSLNPFVGLESIGCGAGLAGENSLGFDLFFLLSWLVVIKVS